MPILYQVNCKRVVLKMLGAEHLLLSTEERRERERWRDSAYTEVYRSSSHTCPTESVVLMEINYYFDMIPSKV